VNKIVNFVFIHLVLSCGELDIGLVYRKVVGCNCLRTYRYTYVKWPGIICKSFLGDILILIKFLLCGYASWLEPFVFVRWY
jgi:hypothetical protein